MAKLRISIVEFLNTAPLVWGFTDGPLAGRYDLSFAVPSLCAEDLRTGRADIGIIPAIEYQRIENLVALPGMAVAAKKRGAQHPGDLEEADRTGSYDRPGHQFAQLVGPGSAALPEALEHCAGIHRFRA